MTDFNFKKYPPFSDGVIDVWVERESPGNPTQGRMPSYFFAISPHGTRERAGQIDVRIGYTDSLVRYGGHIGYRVYEPFRGDHYAARACLLVKQVAIDHGMDVIWITCNPDNWPSRRTCELVGCELVDIVDLPKESDMYRRGERQKCRYRWILYGGSAASRTNNHPLSE